MQHVKELEAVLREIMRRWEMPGLAVGIVEGDEIVHTAGLGVQSLETQVPVTLDSVFCIQSVSKCFVATAVMQMVERGEVELEAPLVQYLPHFQMEDERHRRITVRQALSHTSGMPDMDEIEYVELMTHPEYDDGALERFVRDLKDRRLIANPGERFHYSNIAYNVLGELLAKVSGQSFESAMRERILLPAGMPNSTFRMTDVPIDLLARPHLRSPEMRVNALAAYHRGDAPASFLHTTVVDMCHWAGTALKRGEHSGQRLLSSAGYDRMWTAVIERGRQRPSLYEEMGLGWTLGHYKGVQTVSHGGGGFGGTAFLLILPGKNRAAVILCNEESYAHFQAVWAVADSMLDLEPKADKVSWMVPISRILGEGGIAAATAQYPGIKAREDEFFCNESELIDLSLQLLNAGRLDLAIEVAGLNLQVYPEDVGSYVWQARLYMKKGEMAQARENLSKALAIEPDNASAIRLMEMVQ